MSRPWKLEGTGGDKFIAKAAEIASVTSKLTELIATESDRGTILIIAAAIEETLGELIAQACATEALADSILKHRQPAGDFDSRLLIAHAFGLIHAEDAKALRLIQKIRNKAAHFDRSGRGFDVLFDSPPTMDQVLELARSTDTNPPERNPVSTKQSFIDSAFKLHYRIFMRWVDTERTVLPLSSQEKIQEIISQYEGTEIHELVKNMRAKFRHESSYQIALLTFATMMNISKSKHLIVATAIWKAIPTEL